MAASVPLRYWGLSVPDNMAIKNRIGILGASSMVGLCLLPLLTKTGWQVTAFTRQTNKRTTDLVAWQQLPLAGNYPEDNEQVTPYWICTAPIWVLPDYFDLLKAQGVRRLVVLSSTSRFTKDTSTDQQEQAIALRLADAEMRIQNWAENHGVEWVILRPTLIYGLGLDKNITEIARFIDRFGCFPLFGKANGLRQPIHTRDVADACQAALLSAVAANRAYNISGNETLTYREMVVRVFTALGRRPCLMTVPLWAFRLALTVLRRLPRYRQWSPAMAERMNSDLVFEHGAATRDLDFSPGPFVLEKEDLRL